jgi:hypothetical protein
MRFKKQEPLAGVLLATGLYLVNSLRDRLPDGDELRGRVRDTYGTASERLSRATDALRGKEDSQVIGKVGALLVGVGIGAGIGMLIAPVSGEKMRADISDKVADFSGSVQEKVQQKVEKRPATGTHGV